jgi:hypothetical protein
VAIAVDTSVPVVVAAEVVGRPSATFLRLAAWAADVLPTPGTYAGCVGTSEGDVPCTVRIVDDRGSVWCQPRAPLPLVVSGQGVSVTVFAGSGSGR